MKNKRKSFPISDFAMTLALVAGMALLGACGGGGGADTKTGFGGTGDPTPPATALTAAGPLSAVGIAAIGPPAWMIARRQFSSTHSRASLSTR